MTSAKTEDRKRMTDTRIFAVVLVCSIVLSPIVGAMGTGSESTVTIDSVTIQTAPRSAFDHLDTVSNVSTFATEDETIAIGDVLVLSLSSSELPDALASDSNSTERRLLELVQSGTIDFEISQMNATDDTAKTLNLSATIENGGLRVLPGENTVHIVIDTDRAVFDHMGTTVRMESGDRFKVTSTGHGGSGAAVSGSFRIVSRMVSFNTSDSKKVIVEADSNQTVTGETTVAPGTDLTIRAQSAGQSSFVITQIVQVREDGTFGFDFDFTNVTQGTSFTLTIPDQRFENNASTPGVVRRPPTASVRISNQQHNAESVRTVLIRSVNLSDGGFVAVYNQSFLASDNVTTSHRSFRGTSQYLTPGKHTNVRITLDRPYTHNGTVIVVPHLDTNNNTKYDFITSNGSVDSPYLGTDGDPIVTSANVTVSQTGTATGFASTPSPLATGTDGGNGTTAPSGTNTNGTAEAASGTARSAGNGGTKGGSGPGGDTVVPSREKRTASTQDMTTEALGPGFGFIVGLVALCIAVLFSIRRDGPLS
jgi:hypothetical protein